MGVTIKQIAEMAGVHRSTVDKVLHNRPGVSDSVRKRVQKIIDQCNYQANPIGKALKMQSQQLRIQVLLLEVDACVYLKKGIEAQLKKYSSFQIEPAYTIMPYTDIEQQKEALKKCREEQVDGVILSPTVNTDIKGSQRLCFIGQDGFKAGCVAGRLMGEFLQNKGTVAVFTSDGDNLQSFPFGTREGGFQKVLEEQFPQIRVLSAIHTQEKTQVIRKEVRRLCESQEELNGIFITCGGVRAIGDVLEEYDRQGITRSCDSHHRQRH